VRGAEIFRASNDDRREGLRWTDVDLDAQSLTVFRKKQQWDDASIPAPVVHPLRIYKRVLDPATDKWPVFPTFHYPTLGQLVREDLAAQGYSTTEIDTIRDAHERDLLVCREYTLGPPPSITTHAARSRMKRLCEDAGIELDDQHGYLAPHGGRRGMGEVLVREFGYATAARYLDNSEQMVRERYSHIEAGEQADGRPRRERPARSGEHRRPNGN
jgi:integrase